MLIYLTLLSIFIAFSPSNGQAMQDFEISKFMDAILKAKHFTADTMHPKNDVVPAGTSVGWAYGKSYFSQTSCDDSNIAVQYGIATNMCVSAIVDGYYFSTIVTCGSSKTIQIFHGHIFF